MVAVVVGAALHFAVVIAIIVGIAVAASLVAIFGLHLGAVAIVIADTLGGIVGAAIHRWGFARSAGAVGVGALHLRSAGTAWRGRGLSDRWRGGGGAATAAGTTGG